MYISLILLYGCTECQNNFVNLHIMEEFTKGKIKSVSIKNFKSVKSAMFSDCRRINLLIGKPNVGKSNILEALALFDVPYMVNTSNKSLKNLVRIENSADLFHNGQSTTPVEVLADGNSLSVSRSANNGLSVDISVQNEMSRYSFSSSLTLSTKKEPTVLPDILAYFFPKQFTPESSNIGFLLPPPLRRKSHGNRCKSSGLEIKSGKTVPQLWAEDDVRFRF